MKLLIIISLAILSFNVFSAELGEDPYANQSSKREAKEVAPVETAVQQEATATTSK